MEDPVPDQQQSTNHNNRDKETRSSTRIHPDDVFGVLATRQEFIQEGEWVYSFQDKIYQDMLIRAWLEGYFVKQIEHKGDGEIHVTIQEEQPVGETKMTTKEELENEYDRVYYFKNLDKNPLMAKEVGETIRLGNKKIEIKSIGQVTLEDEKHGYIAGGEQ